MPTLYNVTVFQKRVRVCCDSDPTVNRIWLTDDQTPRAVLTAVRSLPHFSFTLIGVLMALLFGDTDMRDAADRLAALRDLPELDDITVDVA